MGRFPDAESNRSELKFALAGGAAFNAINWAMKTLEGKLAKKDSFSHHPFLLLCSSTYFPSTAGDAVKQKLQDFTKKRIAPFNKICFSDYFPSCQSVSLFLCRIFKIRISKARPGLQSALWPSSCRYMDLVLLECAEHGHSTLSPTTLRSRELLALVPKLGAIRMIVVEGLEPGKSSSLPEPNRKSLRTVVPE